MYPILQHIDAIKKLPDGGYELPAESREFLGNYLRPQGFSLAKLATHRELIDAIRYCNAVEFEQLISDPPPAGASAAICYLWRRLRNLGR